MVRGVIFPGSNSLEPVIVATYTGSPNGTGTADTESELRDRMSHIIRIIRIILIEFS
jgi:hypothetical protein